MENTDALAQLWIYLLSTIAGCVGFTQDFKDDETWRKNIFRLLGRITVSVFAGMMSYQFSIAVGVPKAWTFIAVGIGAWRGNKGLQAISDAWDKRTGVPKDDK